MAWSEFTERWDKSFTVFYIDLPYWGHETDYGRDLFKRDDFARMAELLAGIRGRSILSLEDHPEIRRIFDRFEMDEVPNRDTFRSRERGRRLASELLISNAG